MSDVIHSGLINNLIRVEDSVLVVIDIQDGFMDKYGEAISRPLIDNAVWLIGCAKAMSIPIVAMAEDIPSLVSLNEKSLMHCLRILSSLVKTVLV